MMTTRNARATQVCAASCGANPGRSPRALGFSLLEIMITVLIIGILSAIAYATYTNQVVNSRRAAAANCLQERAQFMERFYTTTLTYAGAPAPAPCGPDIAPFYAVAFVGVPDARNYVIQAAPQGQQAARDLQCATLGINAQGARTASGTASATPEQCW